jgi:hypothetical protein
MKEVSRESLMDVEDYAEIFNNESHHAHRVIEDENGTLRWEEDPVVSYIIYVIEHNTL